MDLDLFLSRQGRSGVLAAALVLLGASAWGQAGAGDMFQFSAEETRLVSASRHPQKISDAPATAQIITAEDIASYGYRTLGEALQSVPGIFATTDRNYTQLWVRGFGRPGDYNNRILVLLNGHRVNENIYGQAFAGFDFSLDLAAVHHIEVVKGPGSALYGDNAFFAVVNVVTQSAEDSPPARARAEGASYGTHREFAEAAHVFTNKLGAYANGAYRHMDGQDLSLPPLTDAGGGHAARRADGEESYSLYTSLSSQDWVLQGSYNDRTKRVPTAPFDAVFNDPGNNTKDARGWLDLALKDRRLGERVRVSGRAYYDWYGYHGDYAYPGQLEKDHAKASWFGEDLNARFTFFGEGNALLVGEDFEKNLLEHQFTYFDPSSGAPAFNDNRAEYRWSLYGQQELALPLDAALTLGLRYDRYQSFGHTFNPRFALVQHPWRGGTFKVLYGEAFRAPTVYERFYAVAPSLANPDIAPEKIKTYEAAYEHSFGPQRTASVSFFQNRISRLIDLDAATNQFVNRDQARTDGVELYAKADLARGLGGHLGYTLQSTRLSGGDRLTNSPTHTANLGLSQRLDALKARLSLEGSLVGRRTTLDRATLPAAALLAAAVRVRPWKDALTVYAGVRNILGTDYRASASNGGTTAATTLYAIPQDGRSFNLGVEYRFGTPYAGL